MKSSRPIKALATAGLLAITCAPWMAIAPAHADTTVYRTIRVQTGKPNRVAVHINLKPDCSRGPLAAIRVKKMPGHGSLVVRRGTTRPGNGVCSAVPTPAQALFYQSREGFSGFDQIEYEVIVGSVIERYTVSIVVGKTGDKTAPQGPDRRPPIPGRSPGRSLDQGIDI